MGKIDVNAAWRPSFLRASMADDACRNARYEASWVSSRNGTGSTLARLAKLLRMRFFSVNEYSVMDLDLSGLRGRTALARPSGIDSPGTLRPHQGWWLATTSRWRTTALGLRHLHRPTKPVFCSRVRRRRQAS